MADNKTKKLNSIKSSVFSRTLKMGKMAVSTGVQLSGYGLNQILKGKDSEQNWKDFLKSQAQSLSQDLGELKGSVMKAGQMLSMFGEHFLPKEANEFLKQLQSQSIPLKWELIDKQIQKMPVEKLAQLEIHQEALASASLGQVHVAKLKSENKLLALKVQYPGVDKSIGSDLKSLKFILNSLSLLPKDLNLDPLFDEVKEMLEQETDYRKEAVTTKDMAERLKGDDRFVVPKVYDEFSTDKILATSLEKGFSADAEEVQGLSQARRNRLALNFIDLYFKELFEWGIVQTDPHLGNYRIRLSPEGQDQIVLLDFGAVRVYPDDFIVNYRQLVKACVLENKEKIDYYSDQLKMNQGKSNPEFHRLFVEFSLLSIEPFKGGIYDWKNTDLPQRLSKVILQLFKNVSNHSPPKELVFLDRKTAGVFIFLSVLGAQIDARSVIMKYLDKI